MDGHTYYFMFDKYKILHVCSDGYTRCGKKIDEFYEEATEDTPLPKYVELCSLCQVPKKTTFETKAHWVEGPNYED